MKSHSRDITCLKVITLGPADAGKTCLLMKAANQNFVCPLDYNCTIGVDFKVKTCLYNNKIPVKMHIWDTAGQERFQQINRMYYRDVKAVLFVFDVLSQRSFRHIDFYWKDFEEFSGAKASVVNVLVGNKCDSERREVSREEGQAWALAHSVPYFETSAKTGEGIPELFDFLLRGMMSTSAPAASIKSNRTRLKSLNPKTSNRKCC